MIATDVILVAALVVFLLAWWRRGLRSRTIVLTTAALIAVLSGVAGVLDYRWQAAGGVIVAGVFLLCILVNKLRGAQARTGTPWLSGSLFTLLVAMAVATIYLFPVPKLPTPGGPYAVGVRDFELDDASRKGVFAAAENEPRRLLVRVWYPSDDVSGLEPRSYFTDEEVNTTATGLGQLIGLPFLFQYVKHSTTNSFPDAPLLQTGGMLPVLVYSHGLTSFASQNTVLMEELASHGYMVYSVQHTYDSAPTVFPNGDVVGMDPALLTLFGKAPKVTEAMKKAFAGATLDDRYEGRVQQLQNAIDTSDRVIVQSAGVWLQDRIFVLDRLQQGAVPESVSEVVAAGDFTHTGQMGMSFGGSATGGFCMLDARCAAGVNLDGGDFHVTPFGANIPVPFMMFYSDFANMAHYFGEDETATLRGFNDFSYERPETSGLRDDVYRVMVKNVEHLGVSDFTLFARNPVRGMLFGSIEADVMVHIQNDFVRGFFDKHLLGKQNSFPAQQFKQYAEWVEPDYTDDVRDWWLTSHPEDQTEQVVLETDIGDIEVALYPALAPVSVSKLLAYVDGGVYDGAQIYRVANTETGLLNPSVTIALVRLEPGTADSGFFINISDKSLLVMANNEGGSDDFANPAFGRVLRGMRVAENIQLRPTDKNGSNKTVDGQLPGEPVLIRRAYRKPRKKDCC